VPADSDALTVLATAENQRDLFGSGLTEELRNVEDQVAGTDRARVAVRSVLEQVPYGTPGRKRMLDIVYELRDDPRAIAGVIALTAAALREVAGQQGPVDASAGPAVTVVAAMLLDNTSEDNQLPETHGPSLPSWPRTRRPARTPRRSPCARSGAGSPAGPARC
jgi:hypothetical protein